MTHSDPFGRATRQILREIREHTSGSGAIAYLIHRAGGRSTGYTWEACGVSPPMIPMGEAMALFTVDGRRRRALAGIAYGISAKAVIRHVHHGASDVAPPTRDEIDDAIRVCAVLSVSVDGRALAYIWHKEDAGPCSVPLHGTDADGYSVMVSDAMRLRLAELKGDTT